MSRIYFLKMAILFFGFLLSGVSNALTLASPAFAGGGVIPNNFGFNQGGCSGGNQSPPLVFGDVPDGVQSFALVVRDLDGGNWLHWKVWNVAATVDVFPQNYSATMDFPQSANQYGSHGWGGPCPPSGSHRYVFTLYALGVPSFSAEPSEGQLAAAALQTATLMGYRAPTDNVSWVSSAVIQNGWWWNPNEGGRGYSIERNAGTGNVFLATYLYAQSGAAMWYSSGMASSSSGLYSGELYEYSNGQSLLGSYRVPVATRYGQGVRLEVVQEDRALLTIMGDATHPGMAVAIRRFEFEPGSLNAGAASGAPQTGWWWSSIESGRGYFIEVQRNLAFIATYMYRADGLPVWYSTYNSLLGDNNAYQGGLLLYGDGQAIGRGYAAPRVQNGNVGVIQLNFSNSTTGTLTLPNGTQIPISRFNF